jgi:16S rRNA processing protein RimM
MTDSGQNRIPAGYVRRAHGIGGDVVVRGTLVDAGERFIEGSVLVTNETQPRELEIQGVRAHQGDYIITFGGVGDRNSAEALKGVQFTIDRTDRRTLEPGEWWPEDLIGCAVVSIDGETIGVIGGIVTGTAQDRIVVERPDGSRGEVPFVAALVPEVDIASRRVVVDLPGGLFE